MAPIRNQRARRTAGPPSSISSLSSTNSIHDSPPAISPTSSVLSGDNPDHPDAAIMGHIRNLLHDNNAWSQVVTRILMAESPEWRRLRQDVSIVNQLLTLNEATHTLIRHNNKLTSYAIRVDREIQDISDRIHTLNQAIRVHLYLDDILAFAPMPQSHPVPPPDHRDYRNLTEQELIDMRVPDYLAAQVQVTLAAESQPVNRERFEDIKEEVAAANFRTADDVYADYYPTNLQSRPSDRR